MKRFLILAAGLVLAPAVSAAPDLHERARALTDAFYAGHMDQVWEHLDGRMRGALGSRSELADYRAQIRRQHGREQAVIDEEFTQKAGYSLYLRTASFDAGSRPVWVQWTFGADGKVAGFFIMPAPERHH